MASAQKTKVLVTGVTGYIGGSVLTDLIKTFGTEQYEYAAPVRSESQTEKLRAIGVIPIIFSGLDDVETCRKIAADHDIVVSCASASHDTSAVAWVEGLNDRKAATGRDVFYLHTSGTSILSDRPVSGTAVPDKIWSDRKDDVFEFERSHPESYGQRVTDVAVLEAAERLGVTTAIVVPCTIYGRGTGQFSKLSQQIPNLIRLAKKRGTAATIGDGSGVWNHVHMNDLVKAYSSLLQGMVKHDANVPTGKKGIYFAVSGECTWKRVVEGIAKAMHSAGYLKTDSVESVALPEAGELIGGGQWSVLELGLASNSRAVPDLCTETLGWKQKHTTEDFLNHFADEVTWMAEELKAMK